MNPSEEDWEMAATIAFEHLEWALYVAGQTPTDVVNGLFQVQGSSFVTRAQAQQYLEVAWLSTLIVESAAHG